MKLDLNLEFTETQCTGQTNSVVRELKWLAHISSCTAGNCKKRVRVS